MGRKPPWGPGIQTPSYILSPLDSGPQFYGLECPFLFLLSFLSGHSKTPAAIAGVFFIYQKRKTVPNAHCRRTGQRVSMSSCEIHRALIYSHHAAMIADYKIHI